MNISIKDHDNLVNRLMQLTPESQALWGVMNVNEMIIHVTQPLLIALGKKQATDESNFLTRTILKFAALRMMSKIPKGIKAPKDFDVKQNGAALNGFEVDRKTLLALMEEFKNDNSVFSNRIHPSFGAFNKEEWATQSFLHLDYHFSQFGV